MSISVDDSNSSESSRNLREQMVSISCKCLQKLTNEEYDGMLFLCSEELELSDDELNILKSNGSKLDFCQVLVRKEFLSETNFGFLSEKLKDVGREDLVEILESIQHNKRNDTNRREKYTSKEIYALCRPIIPTVVVLGGSYWVYKKYGDKPEQAAMLISTAVLPAGTFFKDLFSGSVILVVEATDIDSLDELWSRYQTGKLKKDLEEELLDNSNQDDEEFELVISKENYEDVRLKMIAAEKGKINSRFSSSPNLHASPSNSDEVFRVKSPLSRSDDDLQRRKEYFTQEKYGTSRIGRSRAEVEASKMNAFLVLGKHCMSLTLYDSSIAFLQKCLDLANLNKDGQTEMEASLALGKAQFLNNIQRHDAISSAQNCIEIAKRKGDKAAEAHALNLLGNIYCSLEQFDKAEECTNAALNIAKEHEFQEVEEIKANACFILASISCSKRRYDDAFCYIDKCIQISQKIGDKFKEIRCHLLYGRAHYELIQYEKAIEHIETGLKMAVDEEDKEAEIDVYLIMIIVNNALRRYDEVEKFSNECAKIAKEKGNTSAEIKAYLALGKTYQLQEKDDDVLSYCNECLKCLKVNQAKCDVHFKMQVYLSLAKLYQSINRHDDAITCSGTALKLAKQCGSTDINMKALLLLGKCHIAINKNEEGVLFLRECIHVSQQTERKENKLIEIEAYLAINKACLMLHRFSEIIQYSEECLSTAEEIGEKNSVAKAYLYMANAFIGMQMYDDAIEKGLKCLRIAENTGDKITQMKVFSVLSDAFSKKESYNYASAYREEWVTLIVQIKSSLINFSYGYKYKRKYNSALVVYGPEKWFEMVKDICDQYAELNKRTMPINEGKKLLLQV